MKNKFWICRERRKFWVFNEMADVASFVHNWMGMLNGDVWSWPRLWFAATGILVPNSWLRRIEQYPFDHHRQMLSFAARGKKKLAIWCSVQNSVLSNNCSPLAFFASYGHSFWNRCGICFLPRLLPDLKLAVKYSFCLVENRVLRVRGQFRANPIGSDRA